MAGGRNTRYGGLKAFADIGGRRIVDRVIDALRAATDEVVIIANDADAYGALGLPIRSDEVAHGAALAGLLAALHWSEELGHSGIIAVACDMPFVEREVLQRIRAEAARQDADVVAPESGGRRGIEPLCAFYSNACGPAIEKTMARADLRMIGFHDEMRVVRIPYAEVQAIGDPGVLFMNVNTPEELEAARAIAAERTA